MTVVKTVETTSAERDPGQASLERETQPRAVAADDDPSAVPYDSGGPSDGGGQASAATPSAPTNSGAPNGKTTNSGLVQLKEVLGLWDGVGIMIGIIIGSGIFVSPQSVVQYTGSVGMSLVVWVTSGLMVTMGALCYVELGTMTRKSGGNYVYVMEAFGPFPAFLTLWIEVVFRSPSGRAIASITFANYLLQPFFPDCSQPPYYAVRLLAASMMCFICFINCVGVKLGTRVQDVLSLMKLLALLVIIVVGLQHLARGHVDHFLDPMKGTIWETTSFATAFYSTLFAYSGWNSLNSIVEELKNPYKNLPYAIVISMAIMTVIYTLTNVAYYAVLTPAEILASSAVASTFGDRILGVLAWIISIFVVCSTVGNTNGTFIVNSRIVYAGAREGHLPDFLALIQVNVCTPIPALIFSVILALIMLMVDELGRLLTFTSFCNNLMSVVSVMGLLWLRYKDPDRPRPIKVWLGLPILYLTLSVFVMVFSVIQRPMDIAISLIVMAMGALIYYLAIYLDMKPMFLTLALDKVTYVWQVLLMCTPEEKCE